MCWRQRPTSLSSGPTFNSRSRSSGLTFNSGKIAALRGDIQRDIAETKADILKWMFGMIAGAVIINVMAIIGAMLALVRMVGH